MIRTMTTLLLLTALAMAQGIFGPGGMPLVWGGLTEVESTKFTSPSATSYLSMSGDTLFFTLTGVSSDRDIVQCLVEEDGTKHCWYWNDGGGRWEFQDPILATSNITTLGSGLGFESNAGSSRILGMGASTVAGYIYSSSALPLMIQDPNESGPGTLQLGETGDNDNLHINSNLYGQMVIADSTYQLGVEECTHLIMAAQDTVKLDAAPADTCLIRQIKFTHASGGWLYSADGIDGDTLIVTSEDDAIEAIWDGTEWGIW